MKKIVLENQKLLINKIDQIAFWFIFIHIVIASFLIVYLPNVYIGFLREDALAETCGALFLLITGIVLLISSVVMYQKGKTDGSFIRWRFFMVLAASILFILAFGEEISWGQRLFGIQTPETLKALNRQGEMNLHNLDTRLFNNAIETAILLVILISTIWIHRGKNRLFGFVMPSYWLILCIQLVTSYVTYNYMKTQDYITYIVFVYFLFTQFKSKQWIKFVYVVCAIVLVVVIGVLNANMRDVFPSNGPREFREYLYAFICMIYSFNIFLDIKKPAWISLQ